jgi:putative Ca2+/H+ antiporter (TMEM165/GDT1 family)
MQQWIAVFATVFLAELGDKTQLATLLFAADKKSTPLAIFLAASTALVTTTAIAVVLGEAAERYLTYVPVKLIAGAGFIVIGIWTIVQHFRG